MYCHRCTSSKGPNRQNKGRSRSTSHQNTRNTARWHHKRGIPRNHCTLLHPNRCPVHMRYKASTHRSLSNQQHITGNHSLRGTYQKGMRSKKNRRHKSSTMLGKPRSSTPRHDSRPQRSWDKGWHRYKSRKAKDKGRKCRPRQSNTPKDTTSSSYRLGIGRKASCRVNRLSLRGNTSRCKRNTMKGLDRHYKEHYRLNRQGRRGSRCQGMRCIVSVMSSLGKGSSMQGRCPGRRGSRCQGMRSIGWVKSSWGKGSSMQGMRRCRRGSG